MEFDYLDLRVTKEQKERYKRLCQSIGLSQDDCFLKMLDTVESFNTTTTQTKHDKYQP